MPKQVLQWKNVRYFFIGKGDSSRDIGSEINAFTVSHGGSAVQFPSYGSDSIGREGGLVESSFNFQGYDDAGVDFSKIAGDFFALVPRAKCQQGETVLFGSVVGGQYDMGANVGEAQTFTLDAPVDGWLSRGKVLRNAYRDASDVAAGDTGAATGAEVQLATVGAGEALYAVAFLLSFTGTSISFAIESDATGFASPVSRIALGSLTAPGALYGAHTSAITPDDYYRVVTTGTFSAATFVVAAAVGKT